jgi:hypothetical protein
LTTRTSECVAAQLGRADGRADASNREIDRLNARAQHRRAEHGEVGGREIALQSVHYGLRQGDRVAFTAQHRPPGQARVENGARGRSPTWATMAAA